MNTFLWIRRVLALVALLPVLLAGWAVPTAAQTDERCFAETGHCISGPIRAYWERNGGLPVFGYPITEQRVETVEDRTIPVQWFERDRLEIQADGTITAGRLGAYVLELQWRPWLPGNEQPIPSPECRFFPETGYNICGWILGYWERNGGLERFGYPITTGIEETIEGQTYAVQYFERHRMELHPNPVRGIPDVLLGLLGNAALKELIPESLAPYPQCIDGMADVMQQAHWQLPVPVVLGCPQLATPTNMPAAVQQFERGELIWFDPGVNRSPGGVLPRTILAYIQQPGEPYPSFMGPLTDTWRAGQDPEQPDVAPPPGLYAPWRGFGKVWQENPELAQTLGWAIEPEAQPRRADYQILTGGLQVRLYEEGTRGIVYAFGNPDVPTQVRKVTPQ